MNFATLIAAIARKRLMPNTPHPTRTPTPLRASQGSAIAIEPIPFILANNSGAMFGTMPTDHSVIAVGNLSLFNSTVRFYRAYLSGQEGSFLSLACRGTAIIETRLYRLYTEVNPQSAEEWAFWLDDNGYIGNPTATSLDADGAIPFQRSWGQGSQRIEPFTPIETIVDAAGDTTRLYHRTMHYSRALTDKLSEHLLVSAIGENSTYAGGVTFWLGIDIDPSEIKVYPAADAPPF